VIKSISDQLVYERSEEEVLVTKWLLKDVLNEVLGDQVTKKKF
jgi:hypothetical protein